MDIADFLTQDRIVLDVRQRDKTLLLTEAARLLTRAAPLLPRPVIERALLDREQLGSTGLGGGFALPHARIDGLSGWLGLLLRLARPLEFDAIDGKPVDLVFVLLIPGETTSHVTALAAISRKFRDADVVTKLRKASNAALAFDLLTANPRPANPLHP